MNASASTISSDQENEPEPVLTPIKNNWVADHYTTSFINHKKIRLCKYPGCQKKYAAQSSHQVFKKHWREEHNSRTGSKKYHFMFANSNHTNRMIKMIIGLHLDYSIVDKTLFKDFVFSLNANAQLCCRQTLSRTVLERKEELASKVSEKLSTIDSVALTFDIWSPRKGARGFGCVTAHYLDNQGNINNFILDFKRLKFPHDGKAICDFLSKSIEFNKLEGKISAITTDNASNNTAAIRLLNERMNLGDPEFGFVHYKCVAHIIDLAVRAAMKDLRPKLEKVRSVIMAIRSSSKRKERFSNIQQLKIESLEQDTRSPMDSIEDIDHRWSSGYLMLERALLLEKAIDAFVIEIPELGFESIDWSLIARLMNFLKDLHVVTKRLCTDTDSSISVVSIVMPRLIQHCESYEENIDEFISKAAKSLKDKLVNYISEIYKPVVNLASVLDPRYKTRYFSTDEVAEARSCLQKHLDNLADTSLDRLNSSSSQLDGILTNELGCDEEPFDELETYISTRASPLNTNAYDYWKINVSQYPKLTSIARRILPIQATSVASERVFSVAGDVDTLRRNRLADASVESVVLLKSWMNYLNLE